MAMPDRSLICPLTAKAGFIALFVAIISCTGNGPVTQHLHQDAALKVFILNAKDSAGTPLTVPEVEVTYETASQSSPGMPVYAQRRKKPYSAAVPEAYFAAYANLPAIPAQSEPDGSNVPDAIDVKAAGYGTTRIVLSNSHLRDVYIPPFQFRTSDSPNPDPKVGDFSTGCPLTSGTPARLCAVSEIPSAPADCERKPSGFFRRTPSFRSWSVPFLEERAYGDSLLITVFDGTCSVMAWELDVTMNAN